jgi:uncharacterized membrane protein YphA (DoxX/SURF4 family)
MPKKSSFDIVFIIQIAIAVYFIILGLQGIMNYKESEGFFQELTSMFKKSGISKETELILGIFSLLAGALLLLSLFNIGSRNTLLLFIMIILIVWIARIVMTRFLSEIQIDDGSVTFQPNFFGWLQQLSMDVVILCSIWMIREKHAD